jgi:hypothetical protein
MGRLGYVCAWLCLGLGACATTSAEDRVLRAPDIALAPRSEVALRVETACRSVWIGPTHVRQTVESKQSDGFFGRTTTTISRLEREHDVGDCARPDGVRAVAAVVERQVRQRLLAAGFRLVEPGAGGTPIELRVAAQEIRSLEPPKKQKDKGKEQVCQKVCGSTECQSYVWSGQLEVDATLVGPPVGGKAQESLVVATIGSALREGNGGQTRKIGCIGTDPASWWRDESRYDWANAYDMAAGSGADRLDRAFEPYRESFSVTLFDRGVETPANEAGVELARKGAWNDALGQFRAALAAVGDGGDRTARARVLHNEAAALMTLSRLDEARQTAREAFDTQPDDDTKGLLAEIDRRAWDAAKLQLTGAVAPAGK